MVSSKTSLYQPSDKKHFRIMLRSELIQWKFNKTPLWFVRRRKRLFKKLVSSIDGDPYCVISPFHAQQGNNIHIGKNFFCNFNCTILDHEEVYIGDNVMIAPNVTILTISHPFLPDQRNVHVVNNSFEPHNRGNIEINSPVVIGSNVWLAAGVIVCAGVTIGENSVIGAGSVVTRDIPSGVFACGVPCRVIRPVTEEDRIEMDRET